MAEPATPPTGTLYVVATPIGNLRDVTMRAQDILTSVDVIACEDARTTKTLLQAYGITTPTIAYHQHSGEEAIRQIIDRLSHGQRVAVVTDAGTPGISDPGGQLVDAAYRAGHQVEAVPGASALTAALSVSGVDVSHFVFLGFMPHKGRTGTYTRITATDEAVVFFESTHRILRTLTELGTTIGPRPIVVVKEITKTFERVFRGSAAEILATFASDSHLSQGEFVVIVAPRKWKLG